MMRMQMTLAAVVTALAVPASAHAGLLTVHSSTGQPEYDDVSSQPNHVQLTRTATGIRITDTARIVVLPDAPGCTAAGDYAADCPGRSIHADLGRNADSFSAYGEVSAAVHGGAGADVLSLTGVTGFYGADLWGDDGDDVLLGGPGSENLYGGLGADYISGGGGWDWLYYVDTPAGDPGSELSTEISPRATGVTVTLDGQANDGGQLEHDNVASDIETISGTALHDQLESGDGATLLIGLAGNDTLIGNGGDDDLVGDDGSDTLLPGAGHDLVEGRAGNDFVDAVDGAQDGIDCGGGADTVELDGLDVTIGLSRGAAEDGACETVSRH